MRDLMICLALAMVLGGAASTGRHYLAGQDNTHDLEAANRSVPSAPQRLAPQPSQLRTWADFQTELSDLPASGVVSQQDAKADAQAVRTDDALKAKALPQPPVDSNTPTTPAQPKPGKQMIGPDGVVFHRSASSRHQAIEPAEETRPLDPPASVMAVAVSEEPVPPSTPEPENAADGAVTQSSTVKQSTLPMQTKSTGPMVGPDGVIFRPVGANYSALRR
jgi:hypothetical protein